MSDKRNPLSGMWFYDSYNGTSGIIGDYVGAGFFLEFPDDRTHKNGQRIFNLANLMRSGRFFHTEQQRDAWLAEQENYRNPDYEMIQKITGLRGLMTPREGGDPDER